MRGIKIPMRGLWVPKGVPRVQKGPSWIEPPPPFWRPFWHQSRPRDHLGPLWSASGSILEHLWTALFPGRLFSSISDPPGPPKCAIFIGGVIKNSISSNPLWSQFWITFWKHFGASGVPLRAKVAPKASKGTPRELKLRVKIRVWKNGRKTDGLGGLLPARRHRAGGCWLG